MRNTYKLITSIIIIAVQFILLPIQGNAETRVDSKGRWFAEGDSYAVGWRKSGLSWYLYGSDGYLKTGWAYDNGNWYYLYPDIGWMLHDVYVDGYYLGSNGAWTDDKTNARVTEEAVQATKKEKEKLEALGWIQDGVFFNDEVTLRPPHNLKGYKIATHCDIKNGVATVKGVTTSQNFDEFNKNRNLITLTLDEYMKYKEEGKIKYFTYYYYLVQAENPSKEWTFSEYITR